MPQAGFPNILRFYFVVTIRMKFVSDTWQSYSFETADGT